MKLNVLLKVTLIALALMWCINCRRADAQTEVFTVALESVPESIHPWRGNDASGDRLRQLMFNSLMRKNERFDYVGDLAESVEISPDALTYTFKLRSGITFHDGRELTSRDVKYSLETLLSSTTEYKKSAAFFETVDKKPVAYIARIAAPQPDVVQIILRKPWTPLLSNLVAIAIIPDNSTAQQATAPVGTGAYKFLRANETQGIYEFQADPNHWQGAAHINTLRVKVIRDATSLQAELRSGRVALAPSYSPLSPDALRALSITPGIKVAQFPGANIVYLLFNSTDEVTRNPLVRQAIAYSIDRQTIVDKLLLGQARVAHSILPEESWAYHTPMKYEYNPDKAKQLLDQAGFPDPDGDGSQMRLKTPIVFKLSSAAAVRQYAEVIQNYLKQIGIPVKIETMELTTLLAAQRAGQFQMTTGRWVGGNQDPVFLFDLFGTGKSANRGKYVNSQVNDLLERATSSVQREQSLQLYKEAQEIVNRELPMLPLWYPSTTVVGLESVSVPTMDASGDWSFMRFVKVE